MERDGGGRWFPASRTRPGNAARRRAVAASLAARPRNESRVRSRRSRRSRGATISPEAGRGGCSQAAPPNRKARDQGDSVTMRWGAESERKQRLRGGMIVRHSKHVEQIIDHIEKMNAFERDE